ncbi:MAG TPA: hypothetical protein VE093_07885 [Polyangiaceae bacterium]|jgi:hypothetical protein|nr:hypothetical protein [Polyangiaceae bacterium]
MEQNKVKARRRNRSQEAPIVDDRFRVDTDESEPASKAQVLVSAAPLAFESVPPYIEGAQPSNELPDSKAARSSGVALSSQAVPASGVPSAPSSATAPGSVSVDATASGAPRPAAKRRGWLLLTPAILLGLASVGLALKMVLAPSAPTEKPAAMSGVTAGQNAADSPPAEIPQAKAPPPPQPAPTQQAAPAQDDGLEIVNDPSSPLPGKSANSNQGSRAPRPRPTSPTTEPPKRDPASPVIF